MSESHPEAAPRCGLVLGAGGVLGAAWMMGALESLQAATGFNPNEGEVVVGTSAGSVLAAFIGSGVTVDTLARHQRGAITAGDPQIDYDYDTDTGGALPPRPRLRLGSPALLRSTMRHPRAVTPTAALASLLPAGRGSIAPIGRLIQAVEGEAWPAHPQTWIVTMDYETGRRVVFGRKGSPAARLSDAVMASCAIPAWYAPVEISGRRYVDGGTCSPASVDLLAPLELDEVFVLAPMAAYEYDKPRDVVTRLERRYRRAVTKRLDREVAKVRGTGTRVTVLAPGREDLQAIGVNLMDPRRRLNVFETAVRTTAAALASRGVREPAGLATAG